MLNEVSDFFSIIFINFLFSWVLMIFQFWFKKFKEFIFLQFNFTLDDSLFFQNFLWVSISFCFQMRILFPLWILIIFFFYHSSKDHYLFPFSGLDLFFLFFHFWKDYDPFSFSDFDCFCFLFLGYLFYPSKKKKTSNSLVRMACDCIKCGYPIDRC